MTTRANETAGASTMRRVEEQGTTGTRQTPETQRSTETKSAYKTTELIVYAVAVLAVLLASFIVDGYNATEAWTHFTYLSVAYMISRGLAKSGSREPYRD